MSKSKESTLFKPMPEPALVLYVLESLSLTNEGFWVVKGVRIDVHNLLGDQS